MRLTCVKTSYGLASRVTPGGTCVGDKHRQRPNGGVGTLLEADRILIKIGYFGMRSASELSAILLCPECDALGSWSILSLRQRSQSAQARL